MTVTFFASGSFSLDWNALGEFQIDFGTVTVTCEGASQAIEVDAFKETQVTFGTLHLACHPRELECGGTAPDTLVLRIGVTQMAPSSGFNEFASKSILGSVTRTSSTLRITWMHTSFAIGEIIYRVGATPLELPAPGPDGATVAIPGWVQHR